MTSIFQGHHTCLGRRVSARVQEHGQISPVKRKFFCAINQKSVCNREFVIEGVGKVDRANLRSLDDE